MTQEQKTPAVPRAPMTREELLAIIERQCNCMDMLTADRDRTNVELKRIDVAARKLEDLTKAWKARAEKAEARIKVLEAALLDLADQVEAVLQGNWDQEELSTERAMAVLRPTAKKEA